MVYAFDGICGFDGARQVIARALTSAHHSDPADDPIDNSRRQENRRDKHGEQQAVYFLTRVKFSDPPPCQLNLSTLSLTTSRVCSLPSRQLLTGFRTNFCEKVKRPFLRLGSTPTKFPAKPFLL